MPICTVGGWPSSKRTWSGLRGTSVLPSTAGSPACDGTRTYVNPQIIWASPEMIPHQEGSVSMPGVNDDITRHARVRISYHDVHGNLQTEESEGLRAVCRQHEIDQLNGLFWIKRLSRLKRERLIKRFEKVSRS
jgi:peptide deformylase